MKPMCEGAVTNNLRWVTCGMDAGHLPPHFDPVLKIWWSIPKHEVPEGST